jgi:hypothetical protein
MIAEKIFGPTHATQWTSEAIAFKGGEGWTLFGSLDKTT